MDAKRFAQKQYRDSLLTKEEKIARAKAGHKRLNESRANRRFHSDWIEAIEMNKAFPKRPEPIGSMVDEAGDVLPVYSLS